MVYEINDSAVIEAFNRLLKMGQQPAEMLDAVGSVLETKVRLGFRTSTDPYGRAWAPLTSRAGKPLLKTGVHFLSSISYKVEGDTLTVGSNFRYARTHQFGATITPKTKQALSFIVNGQRVFARKVTIPARPVFPLSGLPPAWRDDVVAELGDFTNDQLKS